MLDALTSSSLSGPLMLFIGLCGVLILIIVLMIRDLLGDRLKYSKPLNAYQPLRRMARKGDPKACLQCADLCERGSGGAHHSIGMAVHYLEQAEYIYRSRMQKGDGYAALKIAEICNHGYSFPHMSHIGDKAYRDALTLNEANARHGDVNGFAYAGYQYRYGLGCISDYDKAMAYLQQAAVMGHAPSMKSLAELYLMGGKAKPDPIAAARLVRQAALIGDAEAVERVGDNYLDSMGEPASREQAYFWYSYAAQKGRRDAMRKLEKIEQSWTPKQLREVQERFRDWAPA